MAIKVLKPELAAVLGADRFVQEVTTTASLQHLHILPLFDSGTADGFLYYVMPFIEGETLRDKLNRAVARGEEAVRIAREEADALDQPTGAGSSITTSSPSTSCCTTGVRWSLISASRSP